jgi:Ca-activated chloride channel family protein
MPTPPPQQDYYAQLGVAPHASEDDIRAAYRALTRRLHPDVNGSTAAANQYRDINAAYTILGNAAERLKYNANFRRETGHFFTTRVSTSQRIISVLDEPQVLYMLVEILPEKQVNLQADTHLNLCLVLDQSTSMRGTRLERVKSATHSIIDQLDELDMFSVVTFSDNAEVLIKSSPMTNRQDAKSRVSMIQPFGGTEIYQGLLRGFQECQRTANKRFVNHIILLTDGRTFGDEQQSLELAEKAFKEGIGISAMGIGDDWNDTFLDQLASRTGGTSEYIQSASAVARFMNERVRSLGQAYAERLQVSVAPDPDIKVEYVFRLLPSAQPVDHNREPIPLGALENNGAVSVLFQLQLGPQVVPGLRSLARVDVTGDVMREQKTGHKVIADMAIEVSKDAQMEEPPLMILDALSKLTLYRLQEKAEEALARGDVKAATRHLQNLSTRLMNDGQPELSKQAAAEAQRVQQTAALSPEGQKGLKYGTRTLFLPSGKPEEKPPTPTNGDTIIPPPPSLSSYLNGSKPPEAEPPKPPNGERPKQGGSS